MTYPFVAEIRMAGFNFAPTGWVAANGQILPISQNTAVFSLLGTMYGGDGRSNFALPDFQGRAPIHTTQYAGNNPLGDFPIGATGGSEVGVFATAYTPTDPAAAITAMTFSTDPVSTMSPYLVLNFIFAMQGVFPPRG